MSTMWLLRRRKRAATTVLYVKLTFIVSLFTLCCVTFLVGTDLRDSFGNSYMIRIYSTAFVEDATPALRDGAKKTTESPTIKYNTEQLSLHGNRTLAMNNGNTKSLSEQTVAQSESYSEIDVSYTQSIQAPNTSPSVDTLGPPISKPKGCQEAHCTEFLGHTEKVAMKSCMKTVAKETQVNLENLKDNVHENDCNFMDGRGRHPVALISPEGSGNTWVRGLLEKATGICTGFLFCDYVMRMKGFIGENVKSGSVLVVKTHTHEPQWFGVKYKQPKRFEAYYGAAIFIVRNPYDALVAEWNRRVTNNFLIVKHLPHNESHTNVVPKEYWSIPEWNDFVKDYMDRWKLMIVNWVLESGDHPVHIVRYENLKRDVAKEVGKMLHFLHIPFNEQELSQRLKSDFNMFKRRHDNDGDFEHYSAKQMEFVRMTISDTMQLVQEYNKTETLKLEDYTCPTNNEIAI